jgi:hypothetical protein
MAAAEQYTVSVPDSTRTFRFLKSMSVEEIRASLVTTGYPAVETAHAVVSPDGNSIAFQRVAGGTKGL